jgi:hypothetical protein
LVMVFFAVILVTSNVASSAKIIDLGFSIFIFPWLLTAGLCFSPCLMYLVIFLPRSTVSALPAV